jgi:hypothetical protein
VPADRAVLGVEAIRAMLPIHCTASVHGLLLDVVLERVDVYVSGHVFLGTLRGRTQRAYRVFTEHRLRLEETDLHEALTSVLGRELVIDSGPIRGKLLVLDITGRIEATGPIELAPAEPPAAKTWERVNGLHDPALPPDLSMEWTTAEHRSTERFGQDALAATNNTQCSDCGQQERSPEPTDAPPSWRQLPPLL